MFRIGAVDPESGVKIHLTGSKAVANEVKADLESRFGPMVLDEVEYNSCLWDPGGLAMIDDEVFSFPVGSTVIDCRAQHFDMFVDRIQQYNFRGDTSYFKIHGKYFCHCLTFEEFSLLKKLVNNPELLKIATEAANKRERKVDKLVEAGYVVRAIKNADGNIRVIRNIQDDSCPVDKNLLN